jgi:hypothetical protein
VESLSPTEVAASFEEFLVQERLGDISKSVSFVAAAIELEKYLALVLFERRSLFEYSATIFSEKKTDIEDFGRRLDALTHKNEILELFSGAKALEKFTVSASQDGQISEIVLQVPVVGRISLRRQSDER